MQHGVIGLNVFSYWFVPLTNNTEDKIATQRANDFFLGWYVLISRMKWYLFSFIYLCNFLSIWLLSF